MNVVDISIKNIGLSNRSAGALLRAGSETVGDMLQWTAEGLSNIPKLGPKSVAEILGKITEYRRYVELDHKDHFEGWIETLEGQNFVRDYFEKVGTKIDEIEILSPKSYNLLMLNGYTHIYQLVFVSKDYLMNIPKMDINCADEIYKLVSYYIKEQRVEVVSSFIKTIIPQEESKDLEQESSFTAWIRSSENCDQVLRYVEENNLTFEELGLSNRAKNQLKNNGYELLSEIVFFTKENLLGWRRMGVGTADEIIEKIEWYLKIHEERIRAFCSGDKSVLLTDEVIERKILDLYELVPFKGFGLNDYIEKLALPEHVTIQRLKKVIGGLLAKEKLEYVDFRCYRTYEKFEEFLPTCEEISERNKMFIDKKLHGYTLEAIGQEAGITRERVRQIIQINVEKARNIYFIKTGMKWFDEDYYRYLYENYDVDRNIGMEWLGVSEAVWRYLELIDVKKGVKDLQEALEDRKVDPGLRLKIKTLINRDKICLDGVWVERRRAEIEDFLLPRICKENVSFDEFTQLYNDYLRKSGIEYDENLYYTTDVQYTRKNRLTESRLLLWKYNEQIRYYDIDGQDYTELLDTLNLDAYENIEISTLKFIEDYPEIMKRYDLRDQYELHNLLRKIIPEGSYHGFHCCRMPDIKFGEFNRTEALLELLRDNVPISIDDFANIVHQEYGYDKPVIIANYLQTLMLYYHQGVFTTEQNEMPTENMNRLRMALSDDFYFMDEIKSIYAKLITGANINEINPYNLKKLGFTVLSKYVLQNHESLDAYLEDLLTKDDIVNLASIKKRFATVVTYYQKLMNLKRDLEIIEFEPDQIINIRKLEKAGVTKDIIREYCDQVYQYLDEGVFFSAKSLRENGFVSELYDLGFSDWFYGSLLLSDERFTFVQTFGTRIFYKGTRRFTTKDFIETYIKLRGSIDVFDLMTDLENDYGCIIENKWDIISKVQSSEIFYDKILERFYANAELFYQELDAVND